jgi:hypothetical protein
MVLAGELVLSIRQQTQTFDESAHLYAGYSYWNEETTVSPPLVKLLAALPLVPMRLPVEPPPEIYFRAASLLGGIQFLYADALLFRARMAVAVFTLCLALLVFSAGNKMFGTSARRLWEFELETRVYRTVEPNFQKLSPPPQNPLGR